VTDRCEQYWHEALDKLPAIHIGLARTAILEKGHQFPARDQSAVICPGNESIKTGGNEDGESQLHGAVLTDSLGYRHAIWSVIRIIYIMEYFDIRPQGKNLPHQ
jgi:hypothetical protein